MIRIHTHSVHATISRDFVITVDETRKVSIYNVTSLMANETSAARQF